jgi:non-ribosomal peptide synthetase component E (peptide arylation enzyme)
VAIERLIASHPAVCAVAVIGMPDRALGERICAYVELKSGSSLSLEGLLSHLRGMGASVLQLPERLEIIDTIPLTKIGKTDKRALKEDVAKKLRPA